MKKNILFFILGAIIFSGIGVAASVIWASDMTYTKEDKTTVTVQKAIDDLYKKAESMPTNTTITIKGVHKFVISSINNDSYIGIVYFNPTNLNAVCNETNITETDKTGCMKWYIYESADTTKYGLLLDHNIGQTACNNIDTFLENLQKEDGWIVEPKLMKEADLLKITGCSEADTSCNFSSSTSISKLHWLFDYTYNCSRYGCKMSSSLSINTGWTADIKDNRQIAVESNGYVDRPLSTYNATLRPIITVSK